MTEKQLQKSYDLAAEDFLASRTTGTGLSGFQNREVEQPVMYSLVPQKLNGLRLLDLGCGPGIHLQEYIRRGAEGFGIDLSEKMIELAKKHCPKANYAVGSCTALPYQDAYFDIVTASFVLDHLQNIEPAIKEVRRVLKNGGLLVYSVPHPAINMFRDSEKGSFVPSNSYFDSSVIMCNIANKGKDFPDYPHTLDEYINIALQNQFVLIKFVENRPNPDWKEKYPDLDSNCLKVPFLCFFSFKKNQ